MKKLLLSLLLAFALTGCMHTATEEAAEATEEVVAEEVLDVEMAEPATEEAAADEATEAETTEEAAE